MTEVIFGSTASEAGFSSLGKWLQCPARAADEERTKAEKRYRGPFPETDKPVSNLVGSLTGEMIARYYRGEPIRPASRLIWQDGEELFDLQKTHQKSVAETWRLYDAYTKCHDPDHFGDPVGFEIPVEVPAELFGLRITGAIDAMFRQTEKSAARIRDRSKRIVEAGQLVQTDWKTWYQKTNLWDWTLTPVMQIYAAGYHLKTGEKPDHLCWNVLKKTKTPDFEEHYGDAVTDAHIRWLKNVIAEVMRRQAAGPIPEPHPNNCVTYGRPCQYLTSAGFCSLI